MKIELEFDREHFGLIADKLADLHIEGAIRLLPESVPDPNDVEEADGHPKATWEPTPPAPPARDVSILIDVIQRYNGSASWRAEFANALDAYHRSTPPPPVAAPDAVRLAKLEEVAVKAKDLRTAIGLSNLDDLSREDTHEIRRKFSHLVTALEALDDPAN
jgi:hypothetical protein